MNRYCKRLYSLIITLLFFCMALSPSAAAAQQENGTSHNKIRIGYYEGDPDFQDGFSDYDEKTGYAYEYYRELAARTGWSYEYLYGSEEQIIDMLISGEADIAAGIYQTDDLSEQLLFSKYDMGLDGEPRYFAVSKSRPDILETLDSTLEEMQFTYPSFTVTLMQKYYNRDPDRYILTSDEKDWLAEKGTLRFGYLTDNLPISGQSEDGSPGGVAGELIEIIREYIDIPVEPVGYNTITLMEDAVVSGEVDAAFPIYSDLWLSEEKGLLQTSAIISERVMLIYSGEYRSDLLKHIAAREDGLGQRYYISSHYPDAQVEFYPTLSDALESVKADNNINCLIGSSSVMYRYLASNDDYQNLNIAFLDTSEDFTAAVKEGNSMLCGILRKTIRQADSTAFSGAMVQYSYVDRDYSLSTFIRENSIAVTSVLCVVIAGILLILLLFRYNTHRFNIQQEKTAAALKDALTAANAANEAKTRFLSNMSHDIRTPMNGIIGMTAIAQEHIADTSRVSDCLTKISSSGKHLLKLINEILDMSKIESGTVNLDEKLFDLSELMDELISINSAAAKDKHQQLIVHIGKISHENVTGDRLRIQQIFTNIVGNAIKYTPDGGRIEISLTENPSRTPMTSCFVFTVADNGIGISSEYLPYVFESFSRDNTSEVKSRQGTGLGMAIARNMARMMDGDITVESELGKGSVFTVMLPLKIPAKVAAGYKEFKGLKILFADSDPLECESVGFMLADLGFDTQWVTSADEAEQRIQKGEKYYAAILPADKCLDKVPELTKYGIKIILTTSDSSELEQDGKKAGVSGFISKPVFRSRIVQIFSELTGIASKDSSAGELHELTRRTDFSGMRAIMAEDNDLNAEIAMDILSMTKLEVDWVKNGKEALEKLESSPPGYYSCIFMDVQMPVMGGIEATKAIRSSSHPDAENIPIFAMTANAFMEDIQAVLSAGMNEHISKPIDFNLVIKTLNRYLK